MYFFEVDEVISLILLVRKMLYENYLPIMQLLIVKIKHSINWTMMLIIVFSMNDWIPYYNVSESIIIFAIIYEMYRE